MLKALDLNTTHFISWLTKQGVYDGHSAISVGLSPYGRGMFASRPIRAGDRMLEVPNNLRERETLQIITSERLPKEINKLLPEEVTEWAKLALFILAEWSKGQDSAWYPYIGILPSRQELHHTIFWKEEELKCVKHSSIYLKTMQRKRLLANEYAAVQNAIYQCPRLFGRTTSYDAFEHAYSIVASRSWRVEDFCNLGMVPYIDLINHDWRSNSLLSNDPDKNCLLVIADRDYAVGEEVSISYGQLSNATLAVDYGFALPYNPFDEAEVWMGISPQDPLYNAKLNFFSQNNVHVMQEEDGGIGKSFTIQELELSYNGLPNDLQNFAQVLSAQSVEDLSTVCKDKSNECWAMLEICSQVDAQIEKFVKADLAGDVHGIEDEIHREMAQALVSGELRTLRSILKWLEGKQPSVQL